MTGMWVIPVPEPEPDQGMVVLPPSDSVLRSQGWGSGLPTEVTGPKRQPGASGPEAGKTGAGVKRTRAETGEMRCIPTAKTLLGAMWSCCGIRSWARKPR